MGVGWHSTEAVPGFQVRGAHLKKLRRAEGGEKIFGVFRVKNHDFTPKNHIIFFFKLIIPEIQHLIVGENRQHNGQKKCTIGEFYNSRI